MSYPTPPVVAPGDILQFIVRCYYGSQLAMNTYWYRISALGLSTDLYTLLDDWALLAAEQYAAVMPSSARVQDVVLYDNVGGIWSEAYFSDLLNLAGSDTGKVLPSQVCGLITRRIDRKGASNRGRVYIPFPSDANLSVVETPSEAYLIKLEALADELLPLDAVMMVGAAELEPGLCNRINAPTTFKTLIDVRCQKKWATQRRRGDYGIPNT